MNVIGTYFLWLFVIMVVTLLLILIQSLICTWSIKVKKSKIIKFLISLLYLGFVVITFWVSLEATDQIFSDFDLDKAYNWLFDLSWEESAQLSLVNLTIFSLLCLFVLIIYRIFYGISKMIGDSTRHKEAKINIFVGRIGRIIHVFVITLSVLSSLVTILSVMY